LLFNYWRLLLIWQNDKKNLYNSACEVFDARSQRDSAYEDFHYEHTTTLLVNPKVY